MFKFKIVLITIFISLLLIGTSILKNQTREIEKQIYYLNKKINIIQKDLNETQLDFFYLTSPSIIEKRIEHLDSSQYVVMEYSKIFLSLTSFNNLQNKIVEQKSLNEQKIQKK